MEHIKDSKLIEVQIKKLPREDMQFVCFDLLHRIKELEHSIDQLVRKKEKSSPVTETARV